MEGTVSEILLALLKKHGVRYICGLPAAQIGGVMDGAGRDPDIHYVTTRHEEAAGHMAHAISRVTDTLGVCFATVGPGATNMLPGVAAAWADNIPLLVLTGNNQSNLIYPGRDLLQNADHIGLYKPITKWNATIREPERAPELIERAIQIAVSGRPGPVHLDLPCDIGFRRCSCDLDLTPVIRPPRPAPEAARVTEAAALLRAAKRPLLLAGGGVARSGAVEEFRELIELTGFPATTTPMGKGVVPPESPSNIGCGGFLAGEAAVKALQEADVLLAVGTKFSTWTLVDKPPAFPRPKSQKIIHVDIDAEMIGKNTRCDLAIVADAREALKALNEELRTTPVFLSDPTWLDGISKNYSAYRSAVEATANAKVVGGTTVLNEAAVARALADCIPEDAIVAVDGGQMMQWTSTFVTVDDPRSILFNPGMGHLGAGLPFANAAKLAHPDRPVVCITGDGAFGCTVQELETAARYGLETITIVCNDSHWGMYRPFAEAVFQNPDFGVKLTDVDFAKVAEGFGCYGEKVATLEDLPSAFARAQNAGRPAVLDIEVEFTPHPMDYVWLTVVFANVDLPVPQVAEQAA